MSCSLILSSLRYFAGSTIFELFYGTDFFSSSWILALLFILRFRGFSEEGFFQNMPIYAILFATFLLFVGVIISEAVQSYSVFAVYRIKFGSSASRLKWPEISSELLSRDSVLLCNWKISLESTSSQTSGEIGPFSKIIIS